MRNILKICFLILFITFFACNKNNRYLSEENKKVESSYKDSQLISKEQKPSSVEDTTKKRKFTEAYYISRLRDSIDIAEFLPVVEKTSRAFAGVYSTVPSTKDGVWEQLVLEFKDSDGPLCTITTYKEDKKISEEVVKDVKVIKDIFTGVRGDRIVRGRFVKVVKKNLVIYGLLLGDGPINKFFELEE